MILIHQWDPIYIFFFFFFSFFFCLICQWLVNFSKRNDKRFIQDTSKRSTAAPQRGIWFHIQTHITGVAIGRRSVDLRGCVLTASTAVFVWTPERAGAALCRLWQVYSCRGTWTQHRLWPGRGHRYSSADTQPHTHTHTHRLHTHTTEKHNVTVSSLDS